MPRKPSHERNNRQRGDARREPGLDKVSVAMPCCGRAKLLPMSPEAGWRLDVRCGCLHRARFIVTSAGPGLFKFHRERAS